jgi:hypothetical protein
MPSPESLRQPSRLFMLQLFVVLFIAQIVLYKDAFQVLPAGDDFSPPLAEIQRGEDVGPAAFFTDSLQDVYRPFQSTTMWLVGRLSEEHRIRNIHIMTFCMMALYGMVSLLWLRQIGLGRMGTIVAGIVVFFHPIFGGPLGGIDNFGSIAAHALMWLGALAIIRFREHFALGLLLAAVCMVCGSLYKEYAFGLIPLGAWTALVFAPSFSLRRGIVRAFIIGLVLLTLMIISLIVRRHLGTSSDDPRLPELSVDMVKMIARNAVLLATATFYTGNTIWVYVKQTPLAFAWVIVNIGSVIALLLIGLRMRLRRDRTERVHADTPAEHAADITPLRWVVFLTVSFVCASFPANMIPYEVSEMYATGVILPLALLCGLAADGFMRCRPPVRAIAGTLLIAHVVVACFAIHAKVHGLRDVGDMADRHLDEVIALLPDDARDVTVTIVFVNADLDPRRTYSAFRMGPDVGMMNPRALNYRLPGRGLVVDRIYVDALNEVDLPALDVVMRWNADTGRFERMK